MLQADAETPAQSWKTDGIAAMEPPGAVTRLFMAIVAFVERLNVKLAKLGNPCIYDRADFPWAAGVEREWRPIRAELDHVLVRKADLPNVQEITADAAALSRDAGWKIFPLVAYGLRSQPNIDLCPQTWRIVQAMPGLTTAMFSILEPGKRIPPHRGPYNGVLRLHLGLMIPQPEKDCWIRVHDQIHQWHVGEALVIDDSFRHEVHNDTDGYRVVLFLDFERPCRYPAKLYNRLLLTVSRISPPINTAIKRQREWEKRRRERAAAKTTG